MKSDLFPIPEVVILNISEGATYYISYSELKFLFRLPIGKEMTLRHSEFIKLIQVFSVNTVNRDEQRRTFVKLSFSKQQKLKQICFLSSTMEKNRFTKNSSKKGHSMNCGEKTENE